MKTNFLFLMSLILGLGFYSCSSDDIIDSPQVEPEAKMQVVSFNLEEFKEVSSLRSTDTPYGIIYLVYTKTGDKTGNFLKKKTFSTDVTRIVNDTLPMGNYYVAVVATDAVEPGDNLSINYTGGYDVASILLKNYDSDVLFSTFELEVGQTDVKKDIVLNRIVNKINVRVEDGENIPTYVVDVIVNVAYNAPTSTHLGAFSPNAFYLANEVTELSNYTIAHKSFSRDQVLAGALDNVSLNVFQTKDRLTDSPVDVGIILVQTAKPEGVSLPYYIIIKNDIKLEGNQTLNLSGKIFENNMSNEITLNTEWGETITELFDVTQ